jgi:ferredoxin
LEIANDLCTNCGICVEACPESVIFLHKGLDVPIMCNQCGACVRFCSTKALYEQK